MNQLATNQPVNNTQVLEMAKSSFMSVAIDKKISWEKEFNFAMQLLANNKYLDDMAWGNTDSLRNAIINVSAIGISLNPATKHAYLVPRKGVVCLDISYMGLLHLACMSGSIEWGQAKLVRANDSYMSQGIDKAPKHEYNPFGEPGEIVGTYCTVKTANGDYLTEEMSIAEVYAIRDRSQAFKSGKTCPWKTDEGQMIRKTVVKRASSYWPKVERLDSAIHMLNTENDEGIDFDEEKKSKVTRPGMNPSHLPLVLAQAFGFIKEAYDAGDLQVVCEKLEEFDINEERIVVNKCFASNERTALKKFDKDGYVKVVNPEKIQYLNDDELDELLEKFFN